MATYYKHDNDKKSGDGLAISEWNTLSSAAAGNSGLHLALAADDNIGIGTALPGAKLQVSGGAIMPAPGDSENRGIVFPKDAGGGIGDSAWLRYYAQSGERMVLEIGTANDADDHISLMPSGNVGIETKNPLGPLSVGDSSVDGSDGFIVIGKKQGNSTRHFRMGFDPDYNFTLGDYGNNNKAGTWKKPFAIHFGAPNSSFYIDKNGKVGIGDTSPDEKLEVKGNVKATKFIGDGSGLTNLRLGNATLEPDNIISVNYAKNWATNNRKFIEFQTNYKDNKNRGQVFLYAPTNYYTNQPAITLAGNLGAGGMVGIATTSPEDTLHVHGGLRLSRSDNFFRMYVESKKLVFKMDESTHGSNKGMSWDGDTNWDSSSDRRLKTNIAQEMDILPRLMQLSVKNFNWKDTPKRKLKSIGFIAQDIEPLFPALVGEMEDPETKESTMTLKYASFGVLAVGAIKELKLEYDKKITTLERKIADIMKSQAATGSIGKVVS